MEEVMIIDTNKFKKAVEKRQKIKKESNFYFKQDYPWLGYDDIIECLYEAEEKGKTGNKDKELQELSKELEESKDKIRKLEKQLNS